MTGYQIFEIGNNSYTLTAGSIVMYPIEKPFASKASAENCIKKLKEKNPNSLYTIIHIY